mmetsp:Transcript_53269/g.105903  ORF Transcript_53269/g.105903 Transcript_53269/m.105903 type:complete len:136 (+) Transcript_53269:52-459(+)
MLPEHPVLRPPPPRRRLAAASSGGCSSDGSAEDVAGDSRRTAGPARTAAAPAAVRAARRQQQQSQKRHHRSYLEKLLNQLQRPEAILFGVWWLMVLVITIYVADLGAHIRAVWRPLLLLAAVPALFSMALCIITL